MLKKKIFKKISILISCAIVILLVVIFPENNTSYTITSTNSNGIIYLLDDNNFLARLDIIYESTTQKGLIKEIIDILTINNKKNLKVRENFYAIIPENTKLLNYEIKDNIANLNFSKEILNISKNFEEKMIEAIVYSITSINNINGVTFYVDGKKLEKLPNSSKPIPDIVTRDYKINKEYNLSGLNNIKETTIYYLAKKDDYTYYIPVTKYENTKKEKVEIIIDELKSSSTYNTNLISYINEETQLIDHQILDKSFILNFNESILNDINSQNIIEEVTYAINLSIQDNYNIDNIMYYINDNILENYFLPRG